MKRLWSALFYSLDGIAAAFRHEEAFRIEVLLSLILIPLALHMHVSAVAKALMIGSIAPRYSAHRYDAPRALLCSPGERPKHGRSRRASDTSRPLNFDFHWWDVAGLIPCRRQTSAVAMPASCSFKTAMICSSLNLLRFIFVRLLRGGLY